MSEVIGVFILGVLYSYWSSLKYKNDVLPLKMNIKNQMISTINNIATVVELVHKNLNDDDKEKYFKLIDNYRNEIRGYSLYSNFIDIEAINQMQILDELLNDMKSAIEIRLAISIKQFNEDRIKVLKQINKIHKEIEDEESAEVLALIESLE